MSDTTVTTTDFADGPISEADLTPRQAKVLEVIRASVRERGYPPSIREIGDAVGLNSTSSVATDHAVEVKPMTSLATPGISTCSK